MKNAISKKELSEKSLPYIIAMLEVEGMAKAREEAEAADKRRAEAAGADALELEDVVSFIAKLTKVCMENAEYSVEQIKEATASAKLFGPLSDEELAETAEAIHNGIKGALK